MSTHAQARELPIQARAQSLQLSMSTQKQARKRSMPNMLNILLYTPKP